MVALRLFRQRDKIRRSNTSTGGLILQEGIAMLGTLETTQQQFYREFLMVRGKFDPAEFGVNLNKEDFIDQMVEDFNDTYRGTWTIDELVLHPSEAITFCAEVKRKHQYFDVPDDIILRVIMQRRKNP